MVQCFTSLSVHIEDPKIGKRHSWPSSIHTLIGLVAPKCGILAKYLGYDIMKEFKSGLVGVLYNTVAVLISSSDFKLSRQA